MNQWCVAKSKPQKEAFLISFVGPRALAADEQRYLEEQIPQFKERLKVKPGLTGLAQLYDHADDPHNKLKYDL